MVEPHSRPSASPSNGTNPLTQTVIGALILALLGVIALAVYFQQFRYDNTYFESSLAQADSLTPSGSEAGAQGSGSPLLPPKSPGLPVPAGFTAMSAPETFDRDTLSEKIDGKAELYLECGFASLVAERFESAGAPGKWFEAFVYDMGTPRNAFAVLSSQRRPQSPESPLAPFAYSTENALYFTHGQYYYELVGAEASPVLETAMAEMGKALTAPVAAETLDLPELAFLPRDDLQAGSVRLQLANGFGFARFDNIVTAAYQKDGTTLQAFVLLRATPEEALQLAKEYEAFLVQLGGERKPIEGTGIPDVRAVDVLGDLDVVFARGRAVAGVHQAAKADVAKDLAANLYHQAGEAAK